MGIQLFRIDDRLIHGQVVIGWASFLNSSKIILCDDSVSENEWEKELYLSIVPENIQSEVLDVPSMAQRLQDGAGDLKKAIILVSSPKVVEALLNAGVKLKQVNVGGIHFKEGRHKYLSYLYLDESEVSAFKRCIERGVRFECQDVPNSKKVPLEHILNNK